MSFAYVIMNVGAKFSRMNFLDEIGSYFELRDKA
jgi:hypothetical protein